jgi:GNAT superfamily N-acetyltransferase
MKIVYTTGSDKNFVELCQMLDENLNEIVGGEQQRKEYVQYNLLNDIHDVVLAYQDDIPVGCASFKQYDGQTAEVKRVFVRKEHRGIGISKQLMREIEDIAKRKGFTTLILETGAPLVEAQSLYKKLGFQVIDNYGQYKDMKGSVCMQKEI